LVDFSQWDQATPAHPASGRSGWQSESPAISIWDQNPRLRGHSLGESYHPIRQFRDNYHIARRLMTLGWLLVCGLRQSRSAACGLSVRVPSGPRRYMRAVYVAAAGIPIHRKPPVLFLSGSICWDQLSILEIIRLPAKPAQVGVCNTILPAKTASHNVQKKMGYSKGKL
jgi:hypothetical protein